MSSLFNRKMSKVGTLLQGAKHTLSHEIVDAQEEINSIIESTDQKKLQAKIRELDLDSTAVNDNIVSILETDSDLFVKLSQCISSFERDFSEFPQKIDSLLTIVSEVSQFPAPNIGEVPEPTILKSAEIINKPAWLVNAPLMYDCLVAQHRIEDSIELVVRCSKSEEQIPSISQWVERTRAILKSEIESRLTKLPINSPQAKNEISRLKALNFEKDAMPLFLNLASTTIVKKMPQFKDSSQFIPFIEESTRILCSEISATIDTYYVLFGVDASTHLTEWVTEQIQAKLPIFRNDIMPGNYAFVKDAVKVTQKELEVLQQKGVSFIYLFESMPDRYCDLLEISSHQLISEISQRIEDDAFDIEPAACDDPGKMKAQTELEAYPESRSLEKFKSVLDSFMKDFQSLYEPTIFFDSANLILNLILSYGDPCLRLLQSFGSEQDTDSRECFKIFRVITVQLGKIQSLLLPEVMKIFMKITGLELPVKKLAEDKINEEIDYVCSLHVQYFFDKWIESIPECENPFDGYKWDSIMEPDPEFENTIKQIIDFIESLKMPKSLYEKTVGFLLDKLIEYAKNAGSNYIENVDMLNSFDFHWVLFSQLMAGYFPREELDTFNANIKIIEKELCRENGINENNCLTPMQVMQAANNYLQSQDNEEDYSD